MPNVNGRPRSNAISFGQSSPVKSARTPVSSAPPQQKSLQERQAAFQRQLKTEAGVSLHSPQVSSAVDQMIDQAQPQDIAHQAGTLAKTGVSLASGNEVDDDWVVLEDTKWVDQITDKDTDDGVVVSTALDDTVHELTEQTQAIHKRLSLSQLKQDQSSTKPSVQVDLGRLDVNYQKTSKEFARLEPGELTASRMTAFETLKATQSALAADTATGQHFNQHYAALSTGLDSVWTPGTLSTESVAQARSILDQAQQGFTDLKGLGFHSQSLTNETRAPLTVLDRQLGALEDQHRSCQQFVHQAGELDTAIADFQTKIESDAPLSAQDLAAFKDSAMQSLTTLNTQGLPEALHPVAQQQLEGLKTKIDALHLNAQRLALDPIADAQKKSADHKVEDVGGSGIDIAAKLSIQWGETHQYDAKNKVTVHTTVMGGEASVSASGSAGPVDVGASLAIRGAKKRAYIQALREGVAPEGLKITPPTSAALAKSPSKCLSQVGDTLILSQNVGISAGLEVGAFGLTAGVEGSRDHEMRMSFQRAPNTSGDPTAPASFYVRVEPENNKAALDGTAKWGPFAVSAGGSTSQSVFYEFEMSETQVQSFLANGKLPLLPDPKKHLLAYQDNGKPTVTEETFGAFDSVNGNGMKLLRFGVSQEVEAHVKGSVAVKGVGAQGSFQKASQNSAVIGPRQAHQRTQESTTKQSKMVFFGETTTRSELNESIHTRRTANGLERSYEGASVQFSLSETQNNPDKLQAQLEEINTLLGRKSTTLLGEARQLDTTRIQLELNLDPAGINALASRAKTLIANPSQIVVIAQKVGVNPAELLQVFEKVEHAEATQHLDKSMSKEQQILRAQGRILGQFAKENGLNGMAALERLSGSELLSLTSESAFYANQLKAIDVENFALGADDGGAKGEFVEMAGKQQSLLILASDLDKAGPGVLRVEAKAELMTDIKTQQAQLDHKMGILLSSPKGRDAALKALLKSESGSSVSVSLRNVISDKLGVIGPRIQNLSEQALQHSMEQVLEAYAQQGSPEEALAVFNQVIADQQTSFSEPLLGLLEQNQSSPAIAGIQKALPQHAPALVKGMDFDQQDRLLKIFAGTPELPVVQQAVRAQRDQVETGYATSLNLPQTYEQNLDGYKDAVHDLDALNTLSTQITGDKALPEDKRSFLLNQCQTRQTKALNHLEKATTASDEGKQAIFNELMNPSAFHYVGNASHALMDRLIQTDKANPVQLKAYAAALLKAPDKEGLRIVTVLNHLKTADKGALKSTLEGLSKDQLKSISNVSQTQGLADTLRKYRENIASDLSPLMVEQLQSLIPEFDAGILSSGVEKGQEMGAEKAEAAVSSGLSAAMTQAIDRLSGEGGSLRDRLFQLTLDSGATGKTEELRTLLPGYKGLESELTEIERKLNKRQDEVSQATPGRANPTETRYKALLLGQRMERFQVELNLQQGALDPALGEQYMQPLSDRLKPLTHKMTADFGLESLNAKDAADVLTHLTAEKPDAEDLPEVNSLVRGLLAKTPESSQTDLLTQKKSVLTLYPKAAAPHLLSTLNSLSSTDRSAALSKMSTQALAGFSKGLSHSDRNVLMGHLEAGGTTTRAARDQFNGLEPGYTKATAILGENRVLPASPLKDLQGSVLTKAFETVSQQVSKLQKAKDLVDGLPENAAQSLSGVSQALTDRDALVSQTALAALSSTQRQLLVQSIVAQSPTDFNKQVLGRVFEASTDVGEIQSHLQQLQGKDSKGNFSAQQFMLRNKLAKSPGNDPTQRAKTLGILTASGAYKKDNAQAVAEVLTGTNLDRKEAMTLLTQERTQNVFIKHIDNKAEVLAKIGVNTAAYGSLSSEEKKAVKTLCRESNVVYKSLDDRLPKVYSGLAEVDKKTGESPLKRAVRKQPLQAELRAAQSELSSLPAAYRLPLEAELQGHIQALDRELQAVVTPSLTDPLAQMKSFKSDDNAKYQSLATLMVEHTSAPDKLEALGKALAQDSRAVHFHDAIFKTVKTLAEKGETTPAQNVFDQWAKSKGFDEHLKTALQSSEQRAVFTALDLPETLRNQIRRLTDA